MAPHRDHIFAGMACAAGMALFLALQALFAKLFVEGGHHVVEAVFWRCAGAGVLLGGYLAVSGRWRVLGQIRKPWTLAARVVNGAVGLGLTFAALAHLPMTDATVLFFVSVLITPLMAIAFLGERVGAHRWAAIGVGMVGVVIAAGPSGAVSLGGVGLGLAAAFSHAATATLLRALRTEPALASAFYFFAGGAVLAGLALPWVGASAPDGGSLPLLAGLIVTGGAAQVLKPLAFQLAPTSIIAPWEYTGLIWVAILDVVIWSAVPGWSVLLGAGIIAAAHLYIIRRERARGRP